MTAYQHGFNDGAEAYRSSGSIVDPVDGWDSDLINAIGLRKVYDLFGLSYEDSTNGEFDSALAEYVRGCRDGVRAEANS